MNRQLLRLVTAGLIFLGTGASHAAAQSGLAHRVHVPAVPQEIEVPAGHSVFLEGYALGTQNFVCIQTSSGFTWRFVGPQATLFLSVRSGTYRQVTTHFLAANPAEGGLPRPAWQHSVDSSRVWGRLVRGSSDPAFVQPGAIPWLLLEAAGIEPGPGGGSVLARTTFIQRVNTSGGLAPDTGCSHSGDVGTMALVPYTADYFFYRASQR